MIVIPYIGSKKRLKDYIVQYIIGTDKYIEPFAGGFSLGLTLICDNVIKSATLNDFDSELTNFWECIKEEPFLLACAYDEIISITLNAIGVNKELEMGDKVDYNVVKDIVKGDKYLEAALYYLQRKANRGKKGKFLRQDKLELSYIVTETFLKARELMSNVTIENRDYASLIEEYGDDKTIFWYLDPPYEDYDNKTFYGVENFDFEKLLTSLGNIKGKFIMSNSVSKDVRDLCKDKFYIKEVKLPSKQALCGYSAELLISNFELSDFGVKDNIVDFSLDGLSEWLTGFSNLEV